MAKRRAEEALAVALDAGRSINVTELAEELISAFGGARNFAQTYHAEYGACKVGGIAKMKMLDGVLKIITAAGAQNKGKGAGDPSGMTDDELLQEMALLLKARGIILGADHAPAEEAGGAAG